MYLPEAQNTPWQQTTDVDLNHTAVVVIDILGGEGGVVPGLETAGDGLGLLENVDAVVIHAVRVLIPASLLHDEDLGPEAQNFIELPVGQVCKWFDFHTFSPHF